MSESKGEFQMKYDFTTVIDRSGQNAMAVDGLGLIPGIFPEAPEDGFDVIPLWIADMSFATCPSITNAIQERVAHPLYGYILPPKEFTDKIIWWHKTRNKVKELGAECIGYENGVIGGVVTAAQVLCNPGENILIHAPIYNGFGRGLVNMGYKLIYSPLVEDQNGLMRMDFADMERRMVENNIHTMVFCNPHNPCGRVWEREELERMLELCEKHDVYIISDEIWSDLVEPGYQHIPLWSLNEIARRRVMAFYALGKTFNCSGMVASYHIICNERLRDLVSRRANMTFYNEMNIFSLPAFLGAYTQQGSEWVDELMQVISDNMDYAIERLSRYPGVKCTKPQATYMLFVDFGEWCANHGMTVSELATAGCKVGVCWQDGRVFLDPNSIRMNLAVPRALLEKAFDRLDKYVFNA